MTQTLNSFFKKINQYFIQRQAVKELNQLSDYELKDIGISRGDILSVVRGDKDMARAADVNDNLKGFV
jgi:uncharacterized protein YjiS (DUF1127 family)